MSRVVTRDYPVLIPYQIDFQATRVGKHIRQSKQHILWRFGFSHIPSLLSGKTGVACRGMELEVRLIWSVASGKHIIYLNNILIYQTPHSSSIKVAPAQKFEHSFNVAENVLPGGHVIHISAWALGVGSHASPEKQFTMNFDGQPYRNFCPMYLLGSSRMMKKYEIALKKAEEKLKRFPPGGPSSGSFSQSNSFDNAATVLGDRPKRTVNQNGMPFPQKGGMTHHRRPSAPEMLPPDILAADVAKSDEEEEILIAQARANSLRDLREHNEQAQTGAFARDSQEQEKYIAQAKVNSFRDMRGIKDDFTVHSFARPPPSSRPVFRSSNLQSVQEGIDLLDTDHNSLPGRGLFRSASNVTLDTAIKTPEDDLMSLASGYSHLDPTKSWQTQQNISFRLQQPPVYADTVAGDLIQPTPSLAPEKSYHGGAYEHDGYGFASPPRPSPMNFAGRHMNYAPGQQQPFAQMQQPPLYPQQRSPQWQKSSQYQVSSQQSYSPQMSSNMSFTAAPQPTFETLNAAFATPSNVAGR